MDYSKRRPRCYADFHSLVRRAGLQGIVEKCRAHIEQALKLPITLPEGLSAHELTERDIIMLKGYSVHGEYSLEDNALYFTRGQWCRPTLVHEVLHAASYFARNEYADISGGIMTLIESLTEFLTGYVLYREHPVCFQNWVHKRYRICSASLLPIYERGVRALAVLCRHASIQEVAALYLWRSEKNWLEAYKEFIARHGLRDFIKECLRRRISAVAALVDALTEAYGEEAAELIYEAPFEITLDFAKMET